MTVAGSDTRTNQVIVQYSAVNKTYDGKHWALKDLNLAIVDGEFLTFLGPSGSGKTTALMLLAGFEHQTDGAVLFRGRSLSSTPPYRRNFGVVFQSYALFPNMTVAQNIAFPLLMRAVSKAERDDRTRRILDMVRLTQFADRSIGQLSGGQQQRVALARALVYNPELVLLDEPMAALDKNLREELQYEIRTLHMKLGLTMVYVTHDQAEALTLSDRIAVFNEGTLQQIAAPVEIYSRPASEFIAGFLGEMNFLNATVVQPGLVELADGTKVQLTAPGGAPIGSSGRIAIRPEKLTIDGANAMQNRLAGIVEDVIFQGNSAKVAVRRSTGDLIVVRSEPTLVGQLLPGVEVHVGFQADSVIYYPALK